MRTKQIVMRGCLSIASLILPGACGFEGVDNGGQLRGLDSVDALPDAAGTVDSPPDAIATVGFVHDTPADFRGPSVDTVFDQSMATGWGTVEPLATATIANELPDGVGGFVATGFEVAGVTIPLRSLLIEDSLIDQSLSKVESDALGAALGVGGADSWSGRWSGQFRIDETGDYDLNALSPFGHRVTLDGVRIKEMVIGGVQNDLLQNVPLSAGWHDIAFDTSTNDSAGAVLTTQLLIGQSGQTLLPLAASQLRPVITGAQRVAFSSKVASLESANGQLKTTDIPVTLPANAIITGFDVSVNTVTSSGTALVQMLPGSVRSTPVTLLMNQVGSRSLASVKINDWPASSGDWQFAVRANAGRNKLTVNDLQLTVHYKTNVDPAIAASASYVRTVDLGRAGTIDNVKWEAQQPSNTLISVRVRACAQKCGEDVPFVEILETGAPKESVRGQFVDYRVGLISDGISVPALTKISISGLPD